MCAATLAVLGAFGCRIASLWMCEESVGCGSGSGSGLSSGGGTGRIGGWTSSGCSPGPAVTGRLTRQKFSQPGSSSNRAAVDTRALLVRRGTSEALIMLEKQHFR